jgi:hypothetical protein
MSGTKEKSNLLIDLHFLRKVLVLAATTCIFFKAVWYMDAQIEVESDRTALPST